MIILTQRQFDGTKKRQKALQANLLGKCAIQKQQIATNVTSQENLLVSTQVINEVCANLIRKAGFDNSQIQNLIEDFSEGCEILPISLETLQYAVKLRVGVARRRHRYLLSFWDSLIVASSVLGQASILYSEDMQNGLIIENSLHIVNPFLHEKT